jgi:two-component system response regulator WspF
LGRIKLRIAIVNDMRLAVEALRRVVLSVPGYEVAWIALNGAEAVENCAKDVPDLILMDLIMPVMDGVEATRRIMQSSPCAILVVTATVAGNAGKVFEAMGYGALDAVCTPVLGAQGRVEGAEPLLTKIGMLSLLITRSTVVEHMTETPPPKSSRSSQLRLVIIGASTGGPKAVADTLRGLTPDLGLAFVLVQHVDEQFAPGLADWLGTQCSMPVSLIRPGGRPKAGELQMAVTNDHLVLTSNLTFDYTPEPRSCSYRPSVDAFFHSTLKYWPSRDMAILLTGMGKDGAKGLLALRKAGWHTVAQNEQSSVLYGMPRAAVELDAACEVLAPAEIRTSIQRFAGNGKGATS